MSAQSARVRPQADAATWREVKRLFQAAIDLPAAKRAGFLRAECGDEEIIKQVESLLLAHQSADDFISQPALVEAGLATSGDEQSSLSSFIGKRIGQYKVIGQLGRGGMG